MKHWKLLALTALLAGCQQDDKASGNDAAKAEQPSAQETPDAKSASINLPDGIQLIETVERKGNETVIPYQKYQLDNGLTVVLHQDDSDPLAHVDVTYHVGSAREELGKSGFAHFFEHMMFQGSEHVADEEHFKIVSEAGGTLNGTTNSDRTNYFQTVPVNQLEKILWLEADRMGFLLKAVTQEKFEVQRETVKNERGQRVDNRPYGRLGETVAEALYPHGHPYSWPVIGYMDDLNRVNVNDLKKFFLRWYGPNNATLTIGGAVDAEETLALVNKYFGSIPRGPEVTMPEKAPVTLDADRYVSFEDNVHLPLIYMTFPTTYARSADEAPLDLLAEILGGGRTSLFYKNLVKNQFAVQATVSHPCQELACQFTMYALPNPASGKSLADLEKIMRDTFAEFEKRGVTEDDLLKAKAKHESNTIFGLQSVAGKVSQLAAYETFTGNPDYISQDIERYNSVTKEDVMRVYNQYIKGKNAVVLSVVPNGKENMVAKKDTYTPAPRDFVATSSPKSDDLDLRIAKDDFDRSVTPKAGANPLVSVPDFWRATTDNKLTVLGAKNLETPTTSLLIKIPGGHYHTSKDKAGLAALTAGLMNESTEKRSTEEMSLALQKLGANINIRATDTTVNIFVSSLTKNLSETMALVNEKILMPAFDESDFNRLKAQTIQGIENSKKQPESLAMQGWLKLLYGNTIAGIDNSGTVSTVNSITLDDVKGFYQSFVKPESAQLIVVSDMEKPALLKEFEVLNQWQGKSNASTKSFDKVAFDPKTVYMVNKDKAAQSVIRIGKRSIPRDFTGEYFKSGLMNFNLGGAFNSRINLNLREDKGYTYGARAYFWGDKEMGGYVASASVRADVTDKSFIEFVNEITEYQKSGMTEDEVAFMRKAVGQRDALKYETPNKKLGFMANILSYDLSENFVEKQANIIKTVSLDELNALAKKHLEIDSMAKLVVGDMETLKPQFEALGYKVEALKLPE
ncbi:M16 family metallopeptidase [Pleionea mediterranea]|uniref:Zinc protease n=1 Tax=Pleionea mediterranea TaxID=523701 RepID=A0A316FVK1_9GAMM|nr:pitrilysin family protein [Pleionea mediterranea]PWK51706.1 zinc protease [Pleionea mediterranea]